MSAARRRLEWAALRAFALASAAALIGAGCSGNPSAANIALRKQNQVLTTQVSGLQLQNVGLNAQVEALQSRPGSTIPQLPESRLAKLYTTHGLQFGRLTGGFPDAPPAPDQMVKVYIVPTDDDGQAFKAAGSFIVELFDLAEPETRLGKWEFPTDKARADWYGASFLGQSLLRTYVLDCPWQRIPRHEKLVVKVTFTDELTARVFNAQQEITVRPPAGNPQAGAINSAQPATQP